MDALPGEMVAHILHHLPLRDRLAVRLVVRGVTLRECFRALPAERGRVLRAVIRGSLHDFWLAS